MNLNLREATLGDTSWYLEHTRCLVAESHSQIPLCPGELFRTPEEQAELLRDASDRGDLFLIAESCGDRVGEVNLRRGSRVAFKHSAVLGISVAREWRGKGIGSALMRSAINWAKAQDFLRRIELYVFATNLQAIRLYERFGFVTEGRRRDAVRVGEGFVDDLVMAYLVKTPNKAPEPTTTSVTSPACAGAAPAVVVAHL